jgi:hypothetical protein
LYHTFCVTFVTPKPKGYEKVSPALPGRVPTVVVGLWPNKDSNNYPEATSASHVTGRVSHAVDAAKCQSKRGAFAEADNDYQRLEKI